MKDLRTLDAFRNHAMERTITQGYGNERPDVCGAFTIPSPIDGADLRVVASAGELGWDHVSVSRKNRCPNWAEMSAVKDLFFLPTETAMQLHVPVAEHINNHPCCLHLWRPTDGREIPMPPSVMVGVKA